MFIIVVVSKDCDLDLEEADWDEENVGDIDTSWGHDSTYKGMAANWSRNKSVSSSSPNAKESSNKSKSQETLSTSGIGSLAAVYNHELTQVRVSSVTSATDLTIQLLSDVYDYEVFQMELQERALGQPPLTSFKVGLLCLAYNTVALGWFRTTIVDVGSNDTDFLVSVRCNDDGSTFSITDKKFLKLLPVNLVFLKILGHRCTLQLEGIENRESDATNFLLEHIYTKSSKEQVSYREVTVFKGIKVIDLFFDGKSAAETIIRNKWAKPQVFVTSKFAYIVYVESSKEFAVQADEDTDALNCIIRYSENFNPVDVENPEIGKLVMAFYEKENTWYRARIVSCLGEKFEVYLIDYGHLATVDMIAQIDDANIAQVHPIATKCSMQLPAGIESLSDNAEAQFKAITKQGTVRFKI